MYKAVFQIKLPKRDVPEEMLPFVLFDAKRRNIELSEDEEVVILKVATTMSYISVPLGKGITIEVLERN